MRAAENLRENETLLRALIDALPEAIFVVDAEAHVLACNPPALAVLPQLRYGEPLARSLRSPDVLDALGRVLAGGGAEKVLWAERLPVECWFEVQLAPLRVPGFEFAAVVSLRDLTEARRVERMRVDFIANASHELRTPLASLLGFVETLQGPAREDSEARARFLGIMREQAQRMARLVDDLLSLSRIEQHLHLRPDTPVDLSMLVAHICDTLAPMAEETDLALETELEPGVIVPGDRDELARVIENLVENAIKYGRPDAGSPGRIEIYLRNSDGFAVFCVRDHGPGIAPEHIPRLTERFYRVDAGKSRAKGGTGLGLAIVKHIVARHRGKLWIELGARLRIAFQSDAALDTGRDDLIERIESASGHVVTSVKYFCRKSLAEAAYLEFGEPLIATPDQISSRKSLAMIAEFLKRAALAVALGGFAAGAAYAGDVAISGAGATFPYPIYAKWADTYEKDTRVKLNYQSIGSGGGIKQIKARTVTFGASDQPLKPEELEAAGLTQWPQVIGGIVPVINLDGVAAGDLTLDGMTIAKIFMGDIKSWDDAAIKKLNPKAKLTSQPIVVAHRSDGSGTTFNFTNYLSKASPAWHDRVGENTSVEWPTGVGAKGNEGVATTVANTKGAIGYVEYAYATQNKLTYTKMVNKDGKVVAPTSETFQAAAANADWTKFPGFYQILTDEPGAKSWPITAATFILLPKQPQDPAVAAEALKFFAWAFAHGGKAAEELYYIPMPAPVVTLIKKSWAANVKNAEGKPLYSN